MSLCRNLTKLCRNFVIRFFARNYSKSLKIFHPSLPIPPKNSLPPPLKLFSKLIAKHAITRIERVMEWREEGLEEKLVGQVARRSRLSRIRAPGGKFVDARGVEGDSPLHKMPIVVDSSQEFGTAITPLMEPPLPLSTGEDRGSVGSSTLGQRGRPLSNFGVSFPRASFPLIRESTRFTYRVAQIYDLLRNNGDPCLKEERANGEVSPISKKIRSITFRRAEIETLRNLKCVCIF